MQRYKLQDARLLAELTQQQLADEMGVDAVTVAHWEDGTETPPPALIKKLCDRFGAEHVSELDLHAQFEEFNRREDEILAWLNTLDKYELLAVFAQLPALTSRDLTILEAILSLD